MYSHHSPPFFFKVVIVICVSSTVFKPVSVGDFQNSTKEHTILIMPIPLQGKFSINVRRNMCVCVLGKSALKKLIQGVEVESIAANCPESDTEISGYLTAYLLS